ncbi:MAG: transporter ATP-binding protein, partial [Candidatus Krumholzibacteriota bacterium]|nr:transporter ATP-binding protein [Candidatus Krumholzibacteriota bacterium]
MQIHESTKQKIRRGWHIKRAVSFVWKSAPGWTATNAVLIVLQGILPLLLLYMMKLVVDSVTAGLSAPDKGDAFREVAIYIAITGGLGVVTVSLSSLARLVNEQHTQVVSDRMYDVLHAKSVDVDLEYYENAQYHDTLYRAQREGSFRPNSIVSGLVQAGQAGISFVAMAGLLFSFHWAIAVILLVAVIPGVLVQLKYAGRVYLWQRKRTPTEREVMYFNWMLTSEIFAKELRVFGLGPLLIDRFRVLRKRLRKERLEIATKRSFSDMAAQAGASVAVYGSYAFIAYRTVQGSITLGDMVMYFGAFQRGLGSLGQMLSALASLYEDNLFLSNLYEFLDLKPKVTEPSNPKPFPSVIQKGIVFDRVGFQYPADGTPVLGGVSLTIEPGETVAMVGENGSGKTTLIKLLCRLYDPTEGSITVDGIDLRDIETADLRRHISVVFQDYVRYNLTARENIWLGNLDLPRDHQRIVDAARSSGAHPVVESLSRGYDTVLGRWFEEGVELSIGEWQKVALARAFLRVAA